MSDASESYELKTADNGLFSPSDFLVLPENRDSFVITAEAPSDSFMPAAANNGSNIDINAR